MAEVTSFRNFVRILEGTMGLPMAWTILNNLIKSAVEPLDISGRMPITLRSQIIFLSDSSLAALTFVLAWFPMPQVELDGPDDQRVEKQGRSSQRRSQKVGQQGVATDLDLIGTQRHTPHERAM
ncbi:hypothetical protein DOTSEDRAFT_55672 [Dothistroma septosporum NZE10]|uniref:Uncharacterized protein n=1 Tax=Dothistroma septosporum (strain NZE10 / CBS 128990) TaxID=675120 RepID=N1PDL1_DOTSN|nr:hypothetical protein DOTSEDRAFT_55672 [Dothistroma septosporum NZE10]